MKINKYLYLKKSLICFGFIFIIKFSIFQKRNFNFCTSSLIIKNHHLTFNLSNSEFYYSHKYALGKISYNIQIFDSINYPILPSDLTLHYNLHLFVFFLLIIRLTSILYLSLMKINTLNVSNILI